ncbi:MAG: thioredoxin family protein [Alcanivorax sp.]|nr:thioredoxin family protein [Alcanivorax sp.]
MALTPSTMVELGRPLPAFSLPDARGTRFDSADLADAPVLVAFICNHCPYVKHIATVFSALARELTEQGLAVVAINSNDWTRHPDDAPDKMRAEILARDYVFPYLADESQEVARAFEAACTPDFFLYDKSHRLVWRGQFDDSRPGNEIPVTGKDLRDAARAVLAGRTPDGEQHPSIGCNIKWRV